MPHPRALSALAIIHQITKDAPSLKIYNKGKIQNQVTTYLIILAIKIPMYKIPTQ